MEKFYKFPDPPELAVQLRTYSVQRWPTMNHEWRKNKLASILRMKARRLASYWYAEESLSPRVDELEAILALLKLPEEVIERENLNELQALKERVARLEALLAQAGALDLGEQVDGGS